MTTWGAWSYGSPSNGVQCGYDYSLSGTTVNVSISTTTQYSFSGNSTTIHSSGGLVLSQAYSFTSSSGQVKTVWTGSYTQAANSTVSSTISMTGFYNGATPSVVMSVTTPPLPPAATSSPTAAYVSDSQATVSWTDNPSGTAPYDSVQVYRATNGGAYAQIQSLAGGATSFADASLAVDRYYTWSATPTNSAGSTASPATANLYTSPAAPSSCSAARSGSDIAISWTNNSSYATAFEVWRSDNGGAYSLISTVMGTTYTDLAPNASQTHQYAVHAKSPANPGGGFLYSANSYSGVVILLARPNPPTGLAFTAPVQYLSVIDYAAGAPTLTWVHNPVDASPQSAWEVQSQVSSDGGATWSALVTTTKNTGTTQSTVAAGSPWTAWADPLTIRWQVRTWGAYAGTAPTYSDWSAWSTIYTSARPIATITSGTTWATSALSATGAYYDAEGTEQAGTRWSLRTTGGVTLETITAGYGNPQRTAVTFATTVNDATSYVVAYQVQDTSGLWSVEVTKTVAVSYAHPPVPSVALVFSASTGSVSGTITNPIPGSGQVPTVSNNVYRDGLLIVTGVAANGSFTDPIPPLTTTVTYTVEAVSATPSSASADTPVSTSGTSGMVWINSGPRFSLSAAVVAGPVAVTDESRVRAWRQYAGRTAPQMYDGEVLAWGVKLSGYADPDEYTALSAVVNAQGVACYRDPDGRRVFVGLGSLSHTRGTGIATAMPFSLPMTQTDFSE